jgi:hypothetical protein
MDLRSPSIELRIEELVLHGVSRPDAERVRDALVNALTEIVEARGGLTGARGTHYARLNGGVVHVGPDGGGAQLGASLADTVYRSVEHAAVGTPTPRSEV